MSTFATTHELVAELRARTRSSRELLDELVTRAERLNPALNAIVTYDIERAAALAAAADEASARGEWWGPLHGIPMTVKDVWETQDLLTTSGAPELADHVPTTDALTVARLKAAGAIVYGKTNTPLYAGDLQTSNELFGVTRNPWDLARTPGGSSGGPAAAVAAGLTPLELGSDIGGSIRMPSHFCGTYGLKPTWGVVPSRGHVPGRPGSLNETDVNCGGPMARDIVDLALAFGVLSGPTPEQAVGWELSLPPAAERDGVRGLRVAFCDHDDLLPVSAEVRAALRRVADALTDAGAFVVEEPLPVPLYDAMRSWQDLVLPIIGSSLPDELYDAFATGDEPPYDSDLLTRSAASLVERHRSWLRAHNRRLRHEQSWAAHFERHDVTIAPVMPTVAFPHDVERPFHERSVDVDGRAVGDTELIAWCAGVGVMRLPVVAMPAGLGHSGLPVGMQVIGAAYRDLDVLAIALAIDQVVGGVGASVGPPPGFGPTD